MDITRSVEQVAERSKQLIRAHAAGPQASRDKDAPLSGEFSLHRGSSTYDLYGAADAAYALHTMGGLARTTDVDSRKHWARRILACQGKDGWFTGRNLRGHSREHATAYAIGALRLLEVEPHEHYVERIRPLADLLPILTDRGAFQQWVERLGFRPSLPSLLRKNLGWHYVWRGSHVGGGVPAAAGMAQDLLEQWWPGQIDLDEWYTWYFEWLDDHANPNTGYWQRAFWNLVVRRPTLIDLGGAVHFLWIYEALGRPFPHPEAVIRSTLGLQRSNGLYGDHPFCIDLDGNFCLIRSYLQLGRDRRPAYRDLVFNAVEGNFEAIVQMLTQEPLEELYADSHGLPGALAALVECAKLPGFKYASALSGWQHPLDEAWWL